MFFCPGCKEEVETPHTCPGSQVKQLTCYQCDVCNDWVLLGTGCTCPPNTPKSLAPPTRHPDIVSAVVGPVEDKFSKLEMVLTVKMASGVENRYKCNVSYKKHLVESYRSDSDGYTPKVGDGMHTLCRVTYKEFKECFHSYGLQLCKLIQHKGIEIDIKDKAFLTCKDVYIMADVAKLGGDVHCTPCTPLVGVSTTCMSVTQTQFGQFIRIMRFLWSKGSEVSVVTKETKDRKTGALSMKQSMQSDAKLSSEVNAIQDMVVNHNLDQTPWFIFLTTELERKALRTKLSAGAIAGIKGEKDAATKIAFLPKRAGNL